MTVLLVPGFMADADLWRDVEAALAPWGPIRHADTSRDKTIVAMAERALAEVEGTFIIIGFSMGGYVAREVARLASERVQALVLVATSARGDTSEQARRKASAAEQVASLSGFAGIGRSVVASALHPDRARDEALVSRIQAMALRLGGEVFRRQSLMPREGDLAELRSIRCQTLVIAGRQDRVRSIAEAEELHAGIPGAELRILEEAGHMLPMEVGADLAAAVTAWLGPCLRRTGVGCFP